MAYRIPSNVTISNIYIQCAFCLSPVKESPTRPLKRSRLHFSYMPR